MAKNFKRVLNRRRGDRTFFINLKNIKSLEKYLDFNNLQKVLAFKKLKFKVELTLCFWGFQVLFYKKILNPNVGHCLVPRRSAIFSRENPTTKPLI